MTAIGTAPGRPAHAAATPSGNGWRGVLRGAANPTLLLGIVAPFAAYELLRGQTSDVTALAVGAAFPAAATLWTLVRTRRPDPIAVMTLAGIVLGLAGALLFDDPIFLLLKESVVTGAIGLVFLGSLAAARPMTFVLARSMTPSDRQAVLEAGWENPRVRAGHRRTTIEWGAALVGEAALRTVLAFVLTPGTLLALSPVLTAVVLGPVVLVTLRRRRRAIAALRQQD